MRKKLLCIVLLIVAAIALTGCEKKYVKNTLDVTKTKEVKLYDLTVTIPAEYEEKAKEVDLLGFQHTAKKQYMSDLTIQSDSIEEKNIETAEDYFKIIMGEEIAKEYTLKEETINDIAWTKGSFQSTSNTKEKVFYNSEAYVARYNGRFYAIIFGYNYKDATYKKALKQMIESVKFGQ